MKTLLALLLSATTAFAGAAGALPPEMEFTGTGTYSSTQDTATFNTGGNGFTVQRESPEGRPRGCEDDVLARIYAIRNVPLPEDKVNITTFDNIIIMMEEIDNLELTFWFGDCTPRDPKLEGLLCIFGTQGTLQYHECSYAEEPS